MASEDLITTRFRIQVPLALQPVSRSLAALHATRARLLLYPAPEADVLRGTHCVRCGTYLLDGSGSVRVVRVAAKRGRRKAREKEREREKGEKPYARVMRRTCGVCGGVDDVPVVPEERVNAKGALRVSAKEPVSRTSSVQASATPTPVESREPSAVSSRQPSVTPNTLPKPSLPSTSSSKASTPSKLSPAPSSAQTLDTRAKARPKKKSGLQDMLARNRERQEQEKKASVGSGLAAFLEGL